jgi:hypothetical protein
MNTGIAHPLDVELPQHNAAEACLFERDVVTGADVQPMRHVARDRDPQDLAVCEHALDEHVASYHRLRQHVHTAYTLRRAVAHTADALSL